MDKPEHLLLLFGQPRFHTMQEQCGFGQQPLRRFHPFYNNAIRILPQLLVVFARQLAAGVDDYRDVATTAFFTNFLQQLETRNIFQSQVEDHTIEMLALQLLQRLCSGRYAGDIYIIIGDKLNDGAAHIVVVLYHQQLLERLRDVVSYFLKSCVEVFYADGFGKEADGTFFHRFNAFVFARHKMHRDMTCFKVFFQAVHHLPAVDAGQSDVEDDGIGFIIIGVMQSRFAVGSYQAFETFFVCQVVKYLCKRSVVFDYENKLIAFVNNFSVVFH